MALNGVMIKINDIFDDLRHENNRLFNELLFANNYINALNAFKDHLFAIYCKCDTHVTEEDKELTTALLDQLKTIIAINQKKKSLNDNPISLIDVTDGQQTSRSYNHRNAIRKTPEEDSEDSDETYVDNNQKRSKKKTIETKVERKSLLKSLLKGNKKRKHLAKETTNTASSRPSRSSATATGRTQYLCRHSGCGQTYDRMSHMRRHYISHMTDRPFRCEYEDCDAVYDYKYLLGQHVIKTHGNPAAEALRRRRLENEQCFDAIVEAYVCPHAVCGGKSYDTRAKFTGHLRIAHPSVEHRCERDGCHKTFKSRTKLLKHEMTHQSLKPYRCPHPGCTYATADKDNLNRQHMIIHSANRPVYACEETDCPKTFRTAQGLRNHVTAEHSGVERQQFPCSHSNCDRVYASGQRLKVHMASHLAEPTLPCGRCSELFRTDWEREKHIKTVHLNKPLYSSSKKAYACEWPGCDYKGSRRGVANHRTLHTGDKPYTCDWPECGKRFRLEANLRDHKNIHYNLRPYACHWPGCSYSCSNSGNLANHLKKSHPNK